MRCRRQFVAELLMSIHDSALADAELATSIEGVICNICKRAPTYASDLVQQAGKFSFTAKRANCSKSAASISVADMLGLLTGALSCSSSLETQGTISGCKNLSIWFMKNLQSLVLCKCAVLPLPPLASWLQSSQDQSTYRRTSVSIMLLACILCRVSNHPSVSQC